MLRNDLIDKTIFHGLLSRHDKVKLHVLLDLFDRLPAVVCQELVDNDRTRKISFAWISISVAWPESPDIDS